MHTEQRAVARLRAKAAALGVEVSGQLPPSDLRKAMTTGDLSYMSLSHGFSSPSSFASSSRLPFPSSSSSLGYLVARKDCNDESAPYWTVSRGIVNRFGHACRECKKGIGKNEEAVVRDGRKLRFFYHPECFSGDADPRTQTGSSAHDVRFRAMLSNTTAPPSKGTGKWSVQSYGLRNAVDPVKDRSAFRTRAASVSFSPPPRSGTRNIGATLRYRSVGQALRRNTERTLEHRKAAAARRTQLSGTTDDARRGTPTGEANVRSTTVECSDKSHRLKESQRSGGGKGKAASTLSPEKTMERKRSGRASKNNRK
ncbi:hypothetical protein CSUI_002353 [Cystoisospora suis]|uniref:PARP-type domain-containing protein n=1 Tax=Cystoisospora suis TaxID=483139 RepID=A0A2C6L8F3_9APIC|nr:hypothetical protein CSUI_002353 [Cystoisospora suis]